MNEKRILIFYPHNFYEMSDGTHRRFYNLLSYFKERDFKIDLLSINGFTNNWTGEYINRRDLFDCITVCNWSPSIKEQFKRALNIKRGCLQDFSFPSLRKKFRRLAESKQYSFVLVSYVYWASLLDEIESNITSIIDLHDFITLNNFLLSESNDFRLGRMFEDEIRAISKFDYALSISEEETLILRPFCPRTKFINVPVSFPEKFQNGNEYMFDILFVGSGNTFNREGIKWFMDGVYPMLPVFVRIAVVGKMCEYVGNKENITLIPYANDLDEIYKKSKIICCPLKGGTGLKVKVVEAMSYGKPVVTTSWGLTGIIQKSNNGCLLADTEKGFSEAILLLLNDRNEYRKNQSRAQDFFCQYYSTSIVYKELDTVFMG